MGGWIGGWIDKWMDGWMDEWMDGWMDEWMDGWMGEQAGPSGRVDGWVSVAGRNSKIAREKMPKRSGDVELGFQANSIFQGSSLPSVCFLLRIPCSQRTMIFIMTVWDQS